MNLIVIGVNHQTAPVEVREQFAIPEARLPEAVKCLASHPGVEEAMIVSTCNRVELVARTKDSQADIRECMRALYGIDPAPYRQHLYEYRDRDAIRHCFRVASSLDSMVVGEPQILGQVKEAYATARAVGAIDSQLDALLSRAFAVAKRVRTETSIATSAVSIASVAVDLAKKIFGNLEGKSVYLVGAGKMCELAARHLLAHGAKKIYVGNRTFERAAALAKKFNGEAIPFEKLYDTVDLADIVISSTGAPHTIFRKEHGEKFLSKRRNRPMFFIDIAVPRDVDPEMNKVDGIFVYDIDDLQQVVVLAYVRPQGRGRPRRSHRRKRSREVSGAAANARRGSHHRLACRNISRPSARPRLIACADGWARSRPSRKWRSMRSPKASLTKSCTRPSPR